MTPSDLPRDAIRDTERDAQLLGLILASRDAIFEIDLRGNFTFVSPAWTRITGLDAPEALSRPLLAYVHEEDRDRVREQLDFLVSGQSRSLEVGCRLVGDRNQAIDVSIDAERRYSTNGKSVVAISGAIRDVTQERMRERQLLEAKRQAEQASAAKAEFLANASHEIRTPLTAILGFAEILAFDAMDSQSRDQLQTIRRNGQYLLQLINDLLDLSKIEAGRMLVETVPCSPLELVNEARSIVSALAAEKGLRLDVSFETPVPLSIQSDPTRLRQVLLNLLSNAVKFTASGGVRVVHRVTDMATDAPKLQVDVIDSGIGIPPEIVNRLFTPFSQAESSTSRQFGGTGLGLAISRRLTRLLGGDLWIEASEVGVGTTFRFEVSTGRLHGIPMVVDPEAAIAGRKQANERTPEAELNGVRVLVAEDGPDNQRLISVILQRAGAVVTVVSDGQEAVERAMTEPFDAILMDMQMPIMDGYAATTELRSRGYEGFICALTANAMSTDRDKCLEVGCDEYLTKPIERATMIALLASAPQSS
ncbi:MAG: response regulator [Planctomycetes bacterium]|nr:response regulator [Planctomycetota bacterium]